MMFRYICHRHPELRWVARKLESKQKISDVVININTIKGEKNTETSCVYNVHKVRSQECLTGGS